jgi:tRNA pseudouridine38-40 synthase
VPLVKIVVEYDGTDFCGFQKQPSVRTVQGELEHSLRRVFQAQSVHTDGSGRTDAGVHAKGQVVSFEAPHGFPVDRIVPAVNGYLPPDVKLMSAEHVPEGFHARYSARARTYTYVIMNRELPSALLARYVWHVRGHLNVQTICLAADEMTGFRDFASFGMPSVEGASTVREVFSLKIRRRGNKVFFFIRGTAFLRSMVRAMVGTLVEAGLGRRGPEDVAAIVNAKDRQAVRMVAPPQGLYLTSVEY